MNPRIQWLVSSMISILLVGGGIAFADNQNPFSVDFYTRYVPKTDVKDQDGKLTWTKISLRLGYHHDFDNGIPLKFTIGPDHYIFEDTSSSAVVPDEVKSRGIRLGTELPFAADGQFRFGFEINPTFQTAKDIGFDSDAFRFNFTPTFIYKNDSGFKLVVGAKIRPEYEMIALPVFGFDYQVNDKLAFHLISDHPSVAYQLTENNTLKWECDYTFDEFEVIDGPQDDSIIQAQDFATGIAIEHSFNKHIAASLGAGEVFDRILKYQNDLGKVVPDSGVYARVGVEAKF